MEDNSKAKATNLVVKTEIIETVSDLFYAFSPFGKYKNFLNPEHSYIFRGEPTASYQLLPGALRPANKDKLYNLASFGKPYGNQSELESWQRQAERGALAEFFKKADKQGLRLPVVQLIRSNYGNSANMHFNEIFDGSFKSKWIPQELLELAGLAQHYGLPTRLLDWTYNVYVAMYFAAINAVKMELQATYSGNKDFMVIWILYLFQIEFLKNTTSRIPLLSITPPYSDNPNLQAQSGVMTYWETEALNWPHVEIAGNGELVNRTPLNILLEEHISKSNAQEKLTYLRKILIPHHKCHTLLSCLREIGYEASQLFPGYDGVVRAMNERQLIDRNRVDE